MRDKQGGHLGIIHAYAYPVASDPRLRDFEERTANAVAISNTHLAVRQTVNCQILAETAVVQIVPL
jgi:hypothetical protein